MSLIAEFDGVVVSLGHGLDDVLVVQVDTDRAAGRIRINVNDAPVWDADPELHEHEFCDCVSR